MGLIKLTNTVLKNTRVLSRGFCIVIPNVSDEITLKQTQPLHAKKKHAPSNVKSLMVLCRPYYFARVYNEFLSGIVPLSQLPELCGLIFRYSHSVALPLPNPPLPLMS